MVIMITAIAMLIYTISIISTFIHCLDPKEETMSKSHFQEHDFEASIMIYFIAVGMALMISGTAWSNTHYETSNYATCTISHEEKYLEPLVESSNAYYYKTADGKTTISFPIPGYSYKNFSIGATDVIWKECVPSAKFIVKESHYSFFGKDIPLVSRIWRSKEFFLEECAMPSDTNFLYAQTK